MSNNMKRPRVLLVGTGKMGAEYAKVLRGQSVDFIVVGRSPESAMEFENATGIRPETGGVKRWLSTNSHIECAIVCVGVLELAEVTIHLLNAGCKRILVEKPAGINVQQLSSVCAAAQAVGSEVIVGYNRRFYSTTEELRRIITEEGLLSFTFDFSEMSDRVDSVVGSGNLKENWLMANSSHVIDLAFHLGGLPKKLTSVVSGGLKWHPSGAVYCGCGITESNVSFSYHSNWIAPGRWGLEFFTPKHRLILRPLEQLSIQAHGSFDIEKTYNLNEVDKCYKPGLYRQVKNFLKADYSNMISIFHQRDLLRTVYGTIMHGGGF